MESRSPQARGEAARLNAAVARAVVRAHAEHVGRGPTKASGFFHGNVVVVVLEDTMSRAERALVRNGGAGAIQQLRRAFHDDMRQDLVSAVEALTGRTVTALLSDCELEPDVSVELFVLDRPVSVGSTAVRLA